MRLTSLVALLVLSAQVLGQAADGTGTKKPMRYVEKAGGYSFVPPAGWTMKDIPGMKYKAAIGPAINDFGPNIVLVDEAFKGNQAEYVAANKKTLAKVFKNYKELSQKETKTDAGAPCTVLVTQREDNGKGLRQTFYFFDMAPGKKIVASCTAPTDGGDKLDALFEASMKSFRVEKP